MPAKTRRERSDPLEKAFQVFAENQVTLQKLIASLATETHRGFDRVARQFEETDKRFRETDKRFRETEQRFRETDERFRHTDKRIEDLVISIGRLCMEFLTRDLFVMSASRRKGSRLSFRRDTRTMATSFTFTVRRRAGCCGRCRPELMFV